MKVFKINDCDWYMAYSLEEAIDIATVDTELPRDEVADGARALSEEEMGRLIFVNRDGSKWPFAVELQNRTQAGMNPGMFATTEE